jgi:hypothetical protein
LDANQRAVHGEAVAMSTLYSRATPRQARILKIVEGSVRNVAHSHPGWITDERAPKSIAKRAAGTLTSQWRTVLGASPRGEPEGLQILQGVIGDHPASSAGLRKPGGAGRLAKQRPAHRLFLIRLGILGREARLETLVEVFRLWHGCGGEKPTSLVKRKRRQ